MKVRIKRMGGHSLPAPAYKSHGAAGFDLTALTPVDGLALETGETVRIPCGFAFEIPPGFEGQVRPRSSVSARGINVAVGTIDSDYRGEVAIVVTALRDGCRVLFTERIAQFVIAPVVRAELEEVDALDETERGSKGFGSSGVQ